MEIICVNDGSPDGCDLILDSYAKKDSRIIVINKKNGGVSSARNAAIEYIQQRWSFCPPSYQEFITFVDPDDYLDIDTFKSCISKFSDEVDVICYGLEKIFDYDVDDDGESCIRSNSIGLEGVCEISNDVIKYTNHFLGAKIYKSNIIICNKIRFPNGIMFEDAYFTAVCLFNCRFICFENNNYYKYLIRRDSTCGKARSKNPNVAIHLMLAHKMLLNYMIANNIFGKFCNFFRYKFYKDFEFVLISSPIEERGKIYNLASSIMEKASYLDESPLDKRLRELLKSHDYAEYTQYSLFRLIKKKHRLSYDKYYIFWIPIYKISYSEHAELLSILGIFKIHLK